MAKDLRKFGAKFSHYKIGNFLFDLGNIPNRRWHYAIDAAKSLAGYRFKPVNTGTFFQHGQDIDHTGVKIIMAITDTGVWKKTWLDKDIYKSHA